jgi:hypothetical protein
MHDNVSIYIIYIFAKFTNIYRILYEKLFINNFNRYFNKNY